MPEDSAIPVEDMKDGDYVVFQTRSGYTMYHRSNGQMWRTTAPSLDQLTIEKATSMEPVEGIFPSDGLSRIMMSGHEEIENIEDLGKVTKIETPEPELPDDLDIDIEMPGDDGLPGEDELIGPTDIPSPETEAPVPEFEVPDLPLPATGP